MNAKIYAKKQEDKESSNAGAAVPNFLTQVKKDDENKAAVSSFFNIKKCFQYLYRCLPLKKQEFNEITEASTSLLEPQEARFKGKKTLVLDLDETLVHSTFEPVANPDLILPVKIQGNVYKINVIIRPGCFEFLEKVGELFEVVIFTASLAEYAEPLCEVLDKKKVINGMLYRQHCTPLNGIYVKDLSLLGRSMKDIILIDNSPNSFLFQPENAYHIKNFFDDKTDRELVTLYHFLEDIADVKDVRPIEDLRRQLEQQPEQSQVAQFFKVFNSDGKQTKVPPLPFKQQAAERERAYNIETEPDLRRDDREGEFVANTAREGNRVPLAHGKAAPLTERIGERPFWEQHSESDVDIIDVGLPSPKESDTLINHKNAYLVNHPGANSENINLNNKSPQKKLQKALEANGATQGHEGEAATIVTVKDIKIDGHDVESVRYLTGFDNLNSPLGRHVEIEFHKSN